jgi:hypothetical protein
VGNSADPLGRRSFIARWNGRTWKHVTSPSPAGLTNILSGVAIAGKDSAWSVGWHDQGQLVLHWNGKAWRRVHIPAAALFGVAAAPGGTAWAVGQATFDSTYLRIERYNGKVWQRITVPASARIGQLTGIAAPSRTSAWAVGTTDQGTTRTLILYWNGRSWRQPAAVVI